jgi:queuosine precursor transporter
MIGYAALALYALTIPAANWMIGNIGQCIPDGPCLIPVGFGLMAPSGVLMIGAALVLRDMVQNRLGIMPAVGAIVIGAVLSSLFAPPALVLASVAAFLLAELADMAVYTPLRRHGLALAVLASGVVGAAIDSAVFLWVAFGSVDFIAGQILGKLAVSVVAAAAIVAIKRLRDAEKASEPKT